MSLHPDDTPSPTKLGLEEHCFNARCLGSIQSREAYHFVPPADAIDGTKGMSIKLLQPLDVPAVRCPGLASTEDTCENNGILDLELCEEWDAVLG